jgi:hypothetical protein
MVSAGVIIVITLSILLRAFRPERFVNPEFFANLKLFLIELKTPSFFLLPNRWLSEAIFNYLNGDYGGLTIFVPLIILTSYITVLLLLPVYRRYHYSGWSMMQTGQDILQESRGASPFISGLIKKIAYSGPVRRLLALIDRQKIMMLKKDTVYQIKDIKNIHQHLILFALLAVYLISIASLPLNWEEYALKLKYIISFFNLGLILIIIASLCSKLFHPVVVSEADALWIIKSSPLTSRKYINVKFFFIFVPIFLLGQTLTIFSSFFIDIEKVLLILMLFTTTMLSFSLVSMGIVFSVSDLSNAVKKSGDEEIKTGNTAYMIISVSLILFTLSLELLPIYLYFLRESFSIEFTQRTWLTIGGIFFIIFLVNAVITVFSVRAGVRKFEAIQFS